MSDQKKGAEPMEIKVGILVSYDYRFVVPCIRHIYHLADKIVLAIDKDRLTWRGTTFDLPKSFFDEVRQIDTQKKVTFFEDAFYVEGMMPMEADTRERRLLAEVMGQGGWHVQIDADEMLFDPDRFIAFLRDLERRGVTSRPVNVHATLLTLFKRVEGGLLYITGTDERFPIATTYPDYWQCRKIDPKIARPIYTDFLVLHDSWARSRDEMVQKLKGWGHSLDFSPMEYLEFWDTVNEKNYRYVHDFHPLSAEKWRELSLVRGNEQQIFQALARAQPAHRRIEEHEVTVHTGPFAKILQRVARKAVRVLTKWQA